MAVTDPTDYAQRFDAAVARTVAEAAAGSAGFAERLRRAGVTADEINSVAQVDRIPIMDKDELLELQHADPPFGGMLARGASVRRVFQSPGPLYEPEPERDDPWRWRPALAAAGFGPGDVVLNAFGYHLSPAGAMFEQACVAVGATVLPGGVGNKDLQIAACRDVGVTAYVGTPSYLKALLEAADDRDTPLQIQRAFVSAEPLPPSLRDWLSSRVPTVRQGFGTAETGNLGYECEAVEGWHAPDDALVQVCDLTTGHATVDDEGQIVVTLLDPDYPIVRFGTGDLSAWIRQPCDCDVSTPRLVGWLGRVGDAVKVKGMFLHPRQVAAVLDPHPDVARYRMVVDRVDHADVLRCEMVPSDGGREDGPEHVRAAIRDGLRFNAEVIVVDGLPDDAPTLVDDRTWE